MSTETIDLATQTLNVIDELLDDETRSPEEILSAIRYRVDRAKRLMRTKEER